MESTSARGGPSGNASGNRSGNRSIGRALGYLRRYRLETAGALLALLLVSAANLVAPQMVRLAIDQGIVGQSRGKVVWAVSGLVMVAVLRGLFNFVQGYLAERASQGVAFDLRDGLFAHIQRLSFSYYDQTHTSQLLTRLTNDVEQVRTFVGAGVVQLVAAVVMLLGCAALLFARNAALAAVAIGCILPILGLLRVFIKRVGPLFGRMQGVVTRLAGVLQEDLQGLKVVRAFSGEAREVARYGRVNDELRDLNLQVVTAIANNFPFVNFFANIGTLAVVGYGGVQVLGARLTVGELIARSDATDRY